MKLWNRLGVPKSIKVRGEDTPYHGGFLCYEDADEVRKLLAGLQRVDEPAKGEIFHFKGVPGFHLYFPK